MMRYKLYIFLFLLNTILFKAQFLDEYPKGQRFYEGGVVQFYKEINEYLIKNKVPECDPKEIYQPRIIVMQDKTVKLVQDIDSDHISKNKCAYDISMDLLKDLKNWKPAEVKGNKLGAVTEFIIYPKDLISGYKSGYTPYKNVTPAQYPGGYTAFDSDFVNHFKFLFRKYELNDDINLEFYISREGEIVNARIYPEVKNEAFNTDFKKALSGLKKKWKPAQYSDIPIKQRVAFPGKFSAYFRKK